MSIDIQSITLQTYGHMTSLNIAKPKLTDSIIVTDIKGLTDTNLSVSLGKTLNNGSYHMGTRPEEREITFTLRLNPNREAGQTVEDLRDILYMHVLGGQSTSATTKITIYGNDRTLVTNGYASQLEADLYTDKPTVQLSFLCSSPYLQEPNDKLIDLGPMQAGKPYHFRVDNFGAPVGIYFRLMGPAFARTFTLRSLTTNDMITIENVTQPANASKYGFEVLSTPGLQRTANIFTDTGGIIRWVPAYDKTTVSGVVPYLASGVNNFAVTLSDNVVPDMMFIMFRPQYWSI